MRIILVSSEAIPFSKTGGLADVASALPVALKASGHDVWVITPRYPRELAKRTGLPEVHSTDQGLEIEIGRKTIYGGILQSHLPNSDVPVFLVDQEFYYDRPGLYQDESGEFRDNCERFIFLCRAAFQIAEKFGLRPDVIHANDWQTGLVPALLQSEYRGRPGFEHAAAVYTIHNMAYQGHFWHWDMLLTGLDWKYFNWRQMEFFGGLNLMKTGIVFADVVTTVSPSYAREIRTPEFGYGLNGVLSGRGDSLVGILNGIDQQEWNPATDSHLVANYDVNTYKEGKAKCKAALQKEMGLPDKPNVPLFGMITRLADQKGLDLVEQCLPGLVDRGAQIVFLGTGAQHYEDLLRDFSERHPTQVAARIGFHEGLAHRIEAGSDLYLMPSRFEPCGLNQMYSMRYGTIPVVHAVGGLADSVIPVNEQTVLAGTANGFAFQEYRGDSLWYQLTQALGLKSDGRLWEQMIRNGMTRDWSWERSAAEYSAVYERAVAGHRMPWAG